MNAGQLPQQIESLLTQWEYAVKHKTTTTPITDLFLRKTKNGLFFEDKTTVLKTFFGKCTFWLNRNQYKFQENIKIQNGFIF